MGIIFHKKIGIITYWESKDNYGQLFQCYALQSKLKSKGYSVYLIKYSPWTVRRTLKGKIYRLVTNIKTRYKSNEKQNDSRQFEIFRRKHIKCARRLFVSIQELRRTPPKADAFICGSDQIWYNNLLEENTAGWFLNFSEKRKIAYAPSIGREIREEEESILYNYLTNLDYISVREQSASELCERIGVNGVETLIDPVFLIERNEYTWLSQYAEKKIDNSIFIYVLNVETKEEIYWNKIEDFSRRNNLNVKMTCSSGYIAAKKIVENIDNDELTPYEWIWAINNSKYVITTSFHGVAFCLKMHTPFCVILLSDKYKRANDRIYTLLQKVDLSDRILGYNDEIQVVMNRQIDWNKVDTLLNAEIKKANIFLEGALEGI